MVLCQKARFDQKNRILIPKTMITEAGGQFDGPVYVSHEEGTNEIRLIFSGRERNDRKDDKQ